MGTGQNENANGLLRQYLPKAMSLLEITKQQVFDAVDKLNNRPRKCLEYKTPYEVFEEMTGITRNNLLGYALISRIQASMGLGGSRINHQ
jgi:IS30 family transposase